MQPGPSVRHPPAHIVGERDGRRDPADLWHHPAIAWPEPGLAQRIGPGGKADGHGDSAQIASFADSTDGNAAREALAP